MIPEKDFQQTVIEMALAFNWIVGFTYDSRKSRPGEPDLRMVRPPRYVVAELKREGQRLTKGRLNKKGKWQTGQDEWAEALEACPGVEYYFWHPSDMDRIEEVLK